MTATGTTPHPPLTRTLSALIDLWLLPALRGWRSAVLLGFLLLIPAAILVPVGMLPQNVYGHDLFIFLDGGWRVFNGQRPHVDFFSSFGPIPHLIWAATLALGHGLPQHYETINVAWGCVIAFWAYAVGRGRLATGPLLLTALYLSLESMGPWVLGHEQHLLSHAMYYNRYGYALTGILFLECLLPPQQRGRVWQGVSTGLVLGILLFLKISFFLVAAALAGASLLRQRSLARVAGIAGGFLVVFTGFLLYLGGDLGAMIQNLRYTASGRGKGMEPARIIWTLTAHVLPLFGLLAVFVHQQLSSTLPRREALWRSWGLAVLGLGAGILLSITNMQPPYFPLQVVAFLMMASFITEQWTGLDAAARRQMALRTFLILEAALLFVAAHFWQEGKGLRFTWMAARQPYPEAQVPRLEPAPVHHLIFREGGQGPEVRQNGAYMVRFVNDGYQLLQAHSRPEESVVTAFYHNPFPFALQRPPSHGGSPFWAGRNNFNPQQLPTLRMLAGDAALIMVPKGIATEVLELPLLIAETERQMVGRYALVAESEFWKMYRRLPRGAAP